MQALQARGYQVQYFDERAHQRYGFPPIETDRVLFLQRQQSEPVRGYVEAHKVAGGKVVYELDDDLWNIPLRNHTRAVYGSHAPKQRATMQTVESILGLADAVVVSTEPLAARVRRINKRVFVAHNCINPAAMEAYRCIDEPVAPKKQTDPVYCGWAGSPTHEDDFLPLAESIYKVMKRVPNLRFRFIGADYRHMFPLSVRIHMDFVGGTSGRSMHEMATPGYYKLLAKAGLHFAIAPIASLTFNRSKSWLKALEYAALGIPTIASNFGPYRDYANSGTPPPVALCSTPAEWCSRMFQFATDRAVRAVYREAGRLCVTRHHLLEHRIGEWESVFASLGLEVAA